MMLFVHFDPDPATCSDATLVHNTPPYVHFFKAFNLMTSDGSVFLWGFRVAGNPIFIPSKNAFLLFGNIIKAQFMKMDFFTYK